MQHPHSGQASREQLLLKSILSLRHQIAHSSEKEVLAPVLHCLLFLGKQMGAAQHIARHPFHPGNVVTAVAALLVAAQTVHGVLCEGQSVHAGVEGQVWGFEILQHTYVQSCGLATWS